MLKPPAIHARLPKTAMAVSDCGVGIRAAVLHAPLGTAGVPSMQALPASFESRTGCKLPLPKAARLDW
jgi:hypothetical protein